MEKMIIYSGPSEIICHSVRLKILSNVFCEWCILNNCMLPYDIYQSDLYIIASPANLATLFINQRVAFNLIHSSGILVERNTEGFFMYTVLSDLLCFWRHCLKRARAVPTTNTIKREYYNNHLLQFTLVYLHQWIMHQSAPIINGFDSHRH